jgi:recombinase
MLIIYLSLQHFPKPNGHDGNHLRVIYARLNKTWSKTALDHILRNPVHCGRIRFNEQQFEGARELCVTLNVK